MGYLALARDKYPHHVVIELRSGHGVGALVPYEPNPESGSVNPNEIGRENAWPRLLAFLAAQ
jgi:hypothetical protein